ncbi:MAG: cytochrome b [Thiobacillus sp.]|jgi:cytochrome b561|uniref:cytochrome b n=1 Tax=Thiobacillus sp. TaxID=924 RepID=UPI002736FCD1|nr:cytochrome b [Thiobacillus sp.]MDP3584248.1 cytochrome b [Thiobacillus sp.]
MSASNRYSTTAILLHWLMALLIFTTFPLGLYMVDLPLSPDKLKLYSYHKWIGVTVFLLIAIRLAWRATHTPPPLPDGIVVWQRRASRIAHGLLYVLMIAIPLSGWLMSSAKGFQTVWFGVLPLPDLLDRNRELGDLLAGVHKALNFSLLALVILHVGAALKHHFIERQPFLQRMGWSRKERT